MTGSLRSIVNVQCLTDRLEDSSVFPGVDTLGGVNGNETFWSNFYYYEEMFRPPKALKTPFLNPFYMRLGIGTAPRRVTIMPCLTLCVYNRC